MLRVKVTNELTERGPTYLEVRLREDEEKERHSVREAQWNEVKKKAPKEAIFA